MHQAWRHTTVAPLLERLREKNWDEFEASLTYIARSFLPPPKKMEKMEDKRKKQNKPFQCTLIESFPCSSTAHTGFGHFQIDLGYCHGAGWSDAVFDLVSVWVQLSYMLKKTIIMTHVWLLFCHTQPLCCLYFFYHGGLSALCMSMLHAIKIS